MFKRLIRWTTPVIAGGMAFTLYPKEYRRSGFGDKRINHINEDAYNALLQTKLFQELNNNPDFKQFRYRDAFPKQHHGNHVITGLLSGKDLFENDPIMFLNEKLKLIVAFYHLGKLLVSEDGQIHNGVTSTILDEGLCSCGFPFLPSKMGVTAKLSIDFKQQAPPDTTVILRGKVIEHKNRKVVIDGDLLTFKGGDDLGGDLGGDFVIAKGNAVLVEPKWFKFFTWLLVM